jgi:hypothetical protein
MVVPRAFLDVRLDPVIPASLQVHRRRNVRRRVAARRLVASGLPLSVTVGFRLRPRNPMGRDRSRYWITARSAGGRTGSRCLRRAAPSDTGRHSIARSRPGDSRLRQTIRVTARGSESCGSVIRIGRGRGNFDPRPIELHSTGTKRPSAISRLRPPEPGIPR